MPDAISECVRHPTDVVSLFFFTDTAPTEIYTLSLHDALPIYGSERSTGPKDASALHYHPATATATPSSDARPSSLPPSAPPVPIVEPTKSPERRWRAAPRVRRRWTWATPTPTCLEDWTPA